MASDGEEEPKDRSATPLWLKIVHSAVLAYFFQNHLGLLRIHAGNITSSWSFVMVFMELFVLVLHFTGFRKPALLLSIGEMAGGHYQHCFTNGHPFWEGLATTYPFMNHYLLSAILSYYTAPTAQPAYKPTLRNALFALVLGAFITRVLMFTVEIIPAEFAVIVSALHIFIPPMSRVREGFIQFLSCDGLLRRPAMASEEDEKDKSAPSLFMKILHIGMLAHFFARHCGLMRYHAVHMSGHWSLAMVFTEILVVLLHYFGMRKAALLISVGEMAGGHFQHCFTNGHPFLEGLMTTFPTMNAYLLSACLAYYTAPWSSPANKPTLRKLFLAIIIGMVVTVVLMTAQVLPAEMVILTSALYLFVPGTDRVRESMIRFVTAE